MTTDVARADEQVFPRPAYAWYVVFVLFLGGMFAFIDRIVVAILTPSLQADLNLNDSQAGLLQGLAFALFYTLFGLPLGWIADRWNRKWLLAIGMTGWSVMTALCGTAKGFGSLFLARIGVGMGEGTLNPCVTSLISDHFPPRTRPRAFGFFVTGASVGNGLTYLFGGMLLSWLTTRGGFSLPGIGAVKPWQAMFMLVGVAGLIPALLLITTVREPPRQEVAGAGGASAAQVLAFIRNNRMTLFCHHAGITLALMVGYGFINWMPTFFLRVHGWEPAQFSKLYGAWSVALAIVSAYSAGWLTSAVRERGRLDATWYVCIIGAAGCTACGIFAPLVPTPEIALALYLIAGVFLTSCTVAGLSCIGEFVPNEMRGTITAIYYMMIGLVASGLGPYAVGLLTDYVFKDKAEIDRSLITLSTIAGIPACVLLGLGIRAFRDSLSRAVWLTRT